MKVTGITGRTRADDAMRQILGPAIENRDWRTVEDAFMRYGYYMEMVEAAEYVADYYGKEKER